MTKPSRFLLGGFLLATASVLFLPVPPGFAATAAQQLRELKEDRGGSDLSFKTVSELTTRTSNEQLAQLAREVGVGRTEGMRGWVRAAVLAEWGRRDFKGAMTHLSSVAEFDRGHQQALYAVFRGSRPAAPDKALAHLQRMFTEYPSAVGAFTRGWSQRALREIFAEMAGRHPEQAWRHLTGDGEGGPERKILEFLSWEYSRHPLVTIDSKWIAMKGFFAGLPDLDAVKTYAPKFGKLWTAPAIVEATKKFHAQSRRNTGSMSWTPPPPHEGVAEAVAISLARFDLQAGIDWIVSSGPGTEQQKSSRAGSMFTGWAWNNPPLALALLRNGKHPRWHGTIATALMRGDARLAPEVVRLFAQEDWLAGALDNSLPAAATMMKYDLYPVPGQRAVLPSHQVRYEAFREALRISPLTVKQLRDVNRSLNGAFRYTVPAAQKAYQVAQRN